MQGTNFQDPLDMLTARWDIRRMIDEYWRVPNVDDDESFWIVAIAHQRGERIGNC